MKKKQNKTKHQNFSSFSFLLLDTSLQRVMMSVVLIIHQLRLPELCTTAVIHKCIMKISCFVTVVLDSAKYLNIYVILLELVDLIYVCGSYFIFTILKFFPTLIPILCSPSFMEHKYYSADYGSGESGCINR